MNALVLAPRTGVHDAGGTPIPLEELLAESRGLPVLLAFFKVTCPVCKLAWPYLTRLHRAYGGLSVRVCGVSQNDLVSSRRFYTDHGGGGFDLFLDPEPRFPASNAFGVESVPHLALVEPDGTLSRSFAGWDRAGMEALGSELAARKGLPVVPVVEHGDPVPAWKPG